MTAANVPSIITSTYNPSFFSSSTSSGGLTQSQANALYLQKSIADTATALETFSVGVATNSMNTTIASSNMDIASTQTSGVLNIGCGTGRLLAGAINIGTGSTVATPITIGSSTSVTTFNSGLTIGSNKNITLPTTITAPTAFTMIGGTSYNTFTNVTFTQTGNVAIVTRQIPNAGTYLLTCSLQTAYFTTEYLYSNIATSATAPTIGLNINGPSYIINTNWGGASLGTIAGKINSSTGGSFVFQATANNYYTFVLIIPAGGYDAPSGYFNFTRLA